MRLWGYVIKPIGSRFRQMMQDRSGIGAVEFALIVPLLLLLYLGAFELTLGLGIASRATSSAGAIADIVARKEGSFTKSFLATMPEVAAGIFAPKSITGYGLKISGIQVDASLNGKIAWSWAQDGTTPYVVGTAVTLPSGMAAASTSFVHVEFSIPYRLVAYLPGMAGSSASTITISRDYYYRQRTTDVVICSDC